MSFYKYIQTHSATVPLTLIACLLVFTSAVVYADGHGGVSNSIKMATSHEPENFTELYFAHYTSLPKNLTVGKIYPVAFTIKNHESKNFVYVYQTELIDSFGRRLIQRSSVSVPNGGSTQRVTHISATRPGAQVELIIKLLNKNLTIHYKAQS